MEFIQDEEEKIVVKRTPDKYEVISLFVAGGMDLGFIQVGLT